MSERIGYIVNVFRSGKFDADTEPFAQGRLDPSLTDLKHQLICTPEIYELALHERQAQVFLTEVDTPNTIALAAGWWHLLAESYTTGTFSGHITDPAINDT